MSHRPASCDFHRLILHQAILVWFSKDCVPATHGSAKFVHRCLTWRLQYSLLCCFDERLNAAFFFFASITVDCFWETQSTKSRKLSWRVFSKRQSGPASFRIPDRPTSTSTAEWSCARSVLAIIPSVGSENKLVGSKRNPRKQTSTPENEKKSQLTLLRSPPRWMQNHHEADPKQQCDRDANDAAKSFDAESYDFDTVWPGPYRHY